MENTDRNKTLNKSASVTIEYARLKLGKRGEKLTDKQINDILIMLRLICNKAIDGVVKEGIFYDN